MGCYFKTTGCLCLYKEKEESIAGARGRVGKFSYGDNQLPQVKFPRLCF